MDEARGSRFPLFTIIVFPSRGEDCVIYECRRLLLRHNFHPDICFATLHVVCTQLLPSVANNQPDTVSSFERILRKMDAIGFLEPTFHFRNVDKSINVGSVGEIRVSDGHSNRSAWTSYRPDANDNETEIRISWPAYLAHVGGHEGGMWSPALLQKYARTVIEAR